ncbi:MAG: pseudouridine synthase, partial [Chloroflexi bacterium]|nr:pseudouridine synthase [Chloroflexota bacterium]
RGADELVAAGRVQVDGRPAVLGERVDPVTQRIEVSGRLLQMPEARPIHLALHKPIGVTATVKDRHADRTIVDLVPAELSRGARLYPVGRLDQDSEGLILVTNDGDWAERVLHPRYGVEREYAVGLAQQLTRAQAEALETGVELSEGVATVTGLRGQTNTEDRRLADMLDPRPDHRLVWVRVTIHQGWKRQLRRMFAEVGAPVRRLVRVRIGALRLEGLAAGDVRPLTPAEVRRLGVGTVEREAR